MTDSELLAAAKFPNNLKGYEIAVHPHGDGALAIVAKENRWGMAYERFPASTEPEAEARAVSYVREALGMSTDAEAL